MSDNLSTKIHQWIVSTGFLTEDQIIEATDIQHQTGESLQSILLRLSYIPDKKTGSILRSQIGLAATNFGEEVIAEETIEKVTLTRAKTHRIIPFMLSGNRLALLTDDIYNFLCIDYFAKILDMAIQMLLIEEHEFDFLFQKYYGSAKSVLEDRIDAGGQIDIESRGKAAESEAGTEDAPIIRLVHMIIAEAIKRKASDIHLEPLESQFRVRYRIDGVLHEESSPPKKLQNSIVSRIKIMAGMDISEKRLPQDGRIKVSMQEAAIDLRVSTLPAVYGESIVMRILDTSNFSIGINDLGFSPEDLMIFEKLMDVPNGIILDTGPTGSGKTTTLYTMLSHLNNVGRKIITIEDPVEYQLSGINQVQVKSSIGMTFAEGLKSMLRQAPDIIMVGEIRDFETAQIAIQAALTGHLVISTLHTNDAAGAVTRLIDMGIKPYLVASSLRGVLAQRLIRQICQKCKVEADLSFDDQVILKREGGGKFRNHKFYRGKGCPACYKTGYSGRRGVFEILMVDQKIRRLIAAGAATTEINAAAKEMGMHSLREDSLRKAAKGLTTLSEVVRIS